ncbi:MAG TPA: AEC family transporter [Candidatus Saccharimonadales bacterium]|nr:AEC family transporter [Candidatus Saccharimonadales bacterium]
MDILVKLLPTFGLIGLGYFLKRQGIFNADLGRTLLKFVFLVAAPVLTLRSISQLHLDSSLLAIFILPLVLTAASYVLVKPLEKRVNLKPKQFAVFLMATMAVNSGFTLPFVMSIAGDDGAARVALFNVLNGFMVFGWVYSIAISYGHRENLRKIDILKAVTVTPAFITLIVALAMNFTSTEIPSWISPTVNMLADLTAPLILLALGLILEPRLMFPTQTFQSLFIRMVGGLAIGVAFVIVFGLTGVDRIAVLILAASPVGFNAVTFSSLEKLDDTFAASIVSMGLLAGLVLISILTVLLS